MALSTKNSYSLFLRCRTSYRFPVIHVRIRLKFEIFWGGNKTVVFVVSFELGLFSWQFLVCIDVIIFISVTWWIAVFSQVNVDSGKSCLREKTNNKLSSCSRNSCVVSVIIFNSSCT